MKIRDLLSLVKIEHTLFALPLALIGTLMAARGLPPLGVLFWVALAFTAARTMAMAFNRIVDCRLDAQNPRTADRDIPVGKISLQRAAALTIVAAAVFFLSAWALNPLCLALSPFALGLLAGYSYTKRFTVLSHYILGLCLGLAPVAGWIAVTGSFGWAPAVLGAGVVFWVGGFDILYACQDVAFDGRTGLFSIPARFGEARAMQIARLSHAAAYLFFVLSGLVASLGWCFFVFSLITAALLYWEHRLVAPDNLTRLELAFFRVNSMVSLSLLLAVIAGLWC